MTDTASVVWNSDTLPYRFEFLFEDARLLGEILKQGCDYTHVQKIRRVAIHNVNGQRFLTVSTGKPFVVKTYELRSDGVGDPLLGDLHGVSETTMNLVFTAENTGDGITYFFKDSAFRPLTQVVVNAAKERANIFS